MLRTADDVLEALHARKEVLQLSDAAVDEIAGLTDGHTNKAIGPARDRTPNLFTLMSLVGALGLAVQLVEDPDAKVQHRWTPRKEHNAHRNRRISRHAVARIMSELGRKSAAKILADGRQVRIAQLGGISRAQSLSARKRKAIARKAIKARWRAVRQKAREAA